MGRPPTVKELPEAHAVESEQISRRIANGDDFPEAGKIWQTLAKKRSAKRYVTGLTALNIPMPDGTTADWHTHGLAHRDNWTWSGDLLMDTSYLIGMAGVHDATQALRQYSPDTPDQTLAANYSRAVFDLLHHFSMIGEPVPNIQAKDIDDSVDFDLVKSWIRSADILSEETKATMVDWFKFME
jgi:hypothetical protein